MMTKSRLPKSIRKRIRKEKARLRREILNIEERNRKIGELYEKLGINYNKKSKIEDLTKNKKQHVKGRN